MEELKSIISLTLIILSINIVYLYVVFKKDYKSYLLIQLEALSKKLGYEIYKDNKVYLSKIAKKNIILGNDIDYQMDISKLTELYFKIYLNYENVSTNTNTFLKIFLIILSALKYILTITFSIGLILYVLLKPNYELASSSLLISLFIGIVSLIVLSILYLPFKKNTIQLTNYFGEDNIKIIQMLYWYIPISVFNSFLRFIDYTRWLFSKD
jgi:hypothetical protein